MKRSNFLLLLFFLLTLNTVHAQGEEKESKISIVTYGGIGYGIVENDNEPNYNLNNSSGEFLLNYNLSHTQNQKLGIATGIGINELTGNGFNSLGDFYHERTFLQVPLLLTFNSKVSDKFKSLTTFGIFGQTIIKDEYRFLNDSQRDIYEGWSFGAEIGLGFLYETSNNFYTGINYNVQFNFSKFQSNDNVGINDEQKMKNLTSIGVMLLFEL